MAQCGVCSHPKVRDINRRVLTGRQLTETARDFEVSIYMLRSHAKNHLPWRSRRRPVGVTTDEQLADLKLELKRLQCLAECGDDVSKALMVIRQRQSLLQLEMMAQHKLGATHSKLFPPAVPTGDYEVQFENGKPVTVKARGK